MFWKGDRMKRLRNAMVLLVFLILAIGTANTVEAHAAGMTPAVLYDEEMIEVTSGEQVYYQMVSSAEKKSGLKTDKWIPAAKNGTKYYIDYASTSNTKDVFVALTTDKMSVTTDTVVVVDAVIKSFKVTLDYKTEKISNAGLADVIAKLEVKGVEKEDNNKDGKVTQYGLIWKRGPFGTWKNYLTFDQVTWDMVKASNGTLYLSMNSGMKVTSVSEDGTVTGAKNCKFRFVKEVKLKIPKIPKAPNIKVDYTKSTLGLKNGMQIRLVQGSNTTDWLTIGAYDKKSENAALFSKDSAAKVNTKVSVIAVDELVKAVGTKELLNKTLEKGKEYTFEVRTAATEKAFASSIATVSFCIPEKAPEVLASAELTYVEADKAKKTAAEFKIDFIKLQAAGIEAGTYDAYEYLLAGADADETVLGTQKWSKIPEDGIADLSKKLGRKYKYIRKTDAESVSFSINYEDTSVIYFRKAGTKGNKDGSVPAMFASEYAKILVVITEKQEEKPADNSTNKTGESTKEN